jgi:ElaB/YqjD/DUF883 family membrane-anchored ribosome-binding protein
MAQEPDQFQESLGPALETESKPEEIREQMAETRAALADKIEKLEDKVLGTVETAQTSVEQTAESVKETVQETAATIQRTFDLKHQVECNPWLMVGGSVLAGYVLGYFVNGRRQSLPTSSERGTDLKSVRPPGTENDRAGTFDEEIQMVKGLAIGVAAGLLRDGLKEAMPSLAAELDQVVNSATRKLGGHPIEGPILGGPDLKFVPRHEPVTPGNGESLRSQVNGRESECAIDGT